MVSGSVLVVVVISLISSRRVASLFDLTAVLVVVVVVVLLADEEVNFSGSRNSTFGSCVTGMIRTLVIPVEMGEQRARGREMLQRRQMKDDQVYLTR